MEEHTTKLEQMHQDCTHYIKINDFSRWRRTFTKIKFVIFPRESFIQQMGLKIPTDDFTDDLLTSFFSFMNELLQFRNSQTTVRFIPTFSNYWTMRGCLFPNHMRIYQLTLDKLSSFGIDVTIFSSQLPLLLWNIDIASIVNELMPQIMSPTAYHDLFTQEVLYYRKFLWERKLYSQSQKHANPPIPAVPITIPKNTWKPPNIKLQTYLNITNFDPLVCCVGTDAKNKAQNALNSAYIDSKNINDNVCY